MVLPYCKSVEEPGNPMIVCDVPGCPTEWSLGSLMIIGLFLYARPFPCILDGKISFNKISILIIA